tara:strand:+ start:403 stop:531 length:129 start_codon:yes stop_codon:yes gene_type:complete
MESDTVNATEAGYYQLISFKIRPFKSKPGKGVELNQIVTSWQ